MNEKEIQRLLDLLEKASPENLRRVLEILLRSPLGRVIKILMFEENIPSPSISLNKEKDQVVGILDIFGAAILLAQEQLLEENKLLVSKSKKIIRDAKNGVKKINPIVADENKRTAEMQKMEMNMLEELIRLIVDYICGTATFGRNDVEIKGDFQITVPKEGNLLCFTQTKH